MGIMKREQATVCFFKDCFIWRANTTSYATSERKFIVLNFISPAICLYSLHLTITFYPMPQLNLFRLIIKGRQDATKSLSLSGLELVLFQKICSGEIHKSWILGMLMHPIAGQVHTPGPYPEYINVVLEKDLRTQALFQIVTPSDTVQMYCRCNTQL